MAILSLPINRGVTAAVLLMSLLIIASEANRPPVITIGIPYSGKKGVLQLSEDTPLNSYLAIMEIKDDDIGLAGEVECITDNPYVSIPLVYPKTYKVVLAKELDRETVNLVLVSIICSDKGGPPMSSNATFTIEIVDINDNAPIFAKQVYNANVTEGAPVGSLVTRVKATDLDYGQNGVIEYYLASDSVNSSHFAIDKETGKIFTNMDIDREAISRHVLTVIAKDLGLPSLSNSVEVSVNVEDVNDNAPVILTKELHIKENQKQMSLVGTVKAEDSDKGKNSELVFSKIEDSESSSTAPFLIHPNGDIISVVSLDREQRWLYTLEVGVRDTGTPRLSSSATISVIVDDVNDNAPSITSDCLDDDVVDLVYGSYSTIGNVSSGVVFIDWYTPDDQRLVYRILAIDEDNGENSKLRYAIESVKSGSIYNTTKKTDSLFKIDHDSGNISLRRFVQKSDELIHILNVSVTDSGNPALSAFCYLNITFNIDLSSLTTPKTSNINVKSNVKGRSSGNTAPSIYISTDFFSRHFVTLMPFFILWHICIDFLSI